MQSFPVEIVFCGNYDESIRREILQKVESNALCVATFKGSLNPTAVLEEYRKADVCCMVSYGSEGLVAAYESLGCGDALESAREVFFHLSKLYRGFAI